ncbi:MAG: DUF6077 domain-containing protein [Actinomycetota bacterium]|nr:hypothetical protein [Rubrobacteraceae bacterium]MDQ3182124.1 DUF6077 domain-containing protein [Actinomycetota bacterium]MDQ3496770.1 DUF6077 domain-containing protein [Actinomycetota bacterium]
MPRLRSLDALVLLSCTAAVILLLPLRGLSGAFPPVAFAATIILFTAPGLLLSHWLLRDDLSGLALVPVGFAISTGVFGLLGVPALVMHLSTADYLLAAGTLLAAFLTVAAWRTLRVKAPAVESSPEQDAPYGPPAGWLWAPFALLCGVLAFVGIRRVPSSYDDIWVYLSWVKDFANSERLALRDPYFGERIAEFSRAKVNGWLLEQAALSRASGLDTIELVLRYLTPTLIVVALLMVYALALTVSKSERAAVLIASVYALFHIIFIQPSVHNVGVELAARISEDKYAARFLILPVTLLFAVLFVESRRWRHLGLFTFFCWAAVAVHPSVLPAIGLCMFGFGVAHVGANPRLGSAWTGMVAFALGMWSVVLGPIILLLFTGRSPEAVLFSADINATPPKVLEYTVFITESWRHIYELGEGYYIMHPWLLLNPVILGAYVFGVPFLLWRVRTSVAAQLLLGGLGVVTVAVYVPPVATFIGNDLIVPGLLWRLAWPIPLLAMITVGWMLWEALGYAEMRLRGFGIGYSVTRVLPLALVALLTAAAAPPSVEKAVGLYRNFDVARTSDYDPDPIYPWIRDNIRDPGVLLARDSANNAVPAYSASLNVVSQRGEGMIRDRDELEKLAGSHINIPQRYLDVHDFFFGPILDREAYDILRRYHADYLMVYAGRPLDERLKTLPGFSPVNDAPREKYSLYAVDLRELGEPAHGPERPRETAPPAPEQS